MCSTPKKTRAIKIYIDGESEASMNHRKTNWIFLYMGAILSHPPYFRKRGFKSFSKIEGIFGVMGYKPSPFLIKRLGLGITQPSGPEMKTGSHLIRWQRCLGSAFMHDTVFSRPLLLSLYLHPLGKAVSLLFIVAEIPHSLLSYMYRFPLKYISVCLN